MPVLLLELFKENSLQRSVLIGFCLAEEQCGIKKGYFSSYLLTFLLCQLYFEC